jgi:hypothetical protein
MGSERERGKVLQQTADSSPEQANAAPAQEMLSPGWMSSPKAGSPQPQEQPEMLSPPWMSPVPKDPAAQATNAPGKPQEMLSPAWMSSRQTAPSPEAVPSAEHSLAKLALASNASPDTVSLNKKFIDAPMLTPSPTASPTDAATLASASLHEIHATASTNDVGITPSARAVASPQLAPFEQSIDTSSSTAIDQSSAETPSLSENYDTKILNNSNGKEKYDNKEGFDDINNGKSKEQDQKNKAHTECEI